MRRILTIVTSLVILAVFSWTLLFLYQKSQAVPETFETAQPSVRDIVKKSVATGAIVPRREIELKPRVSGVLEALFVEAGDLVTEGQKIATIRIIPNMVTLNTAESTAASARISYRNARSEYKRNETLFKRGVISETELNRFRLDYELRQQELRAAESNVQLIKSGVAKGGKVSNMVASTVNGMIIDVPEKVGASVTEANNFNPGTTIAVIADMKDMIFEGQVDESEVGKIEVGMPLDIVIGAIDDKHFSGTLEYIAPKGTMIDGAIQFEVRAAMSLSPEDFVRAGYSANADIVLSRRDQVLSISESLLRFDGKQPYVEVEVAPKVFERREVAVGLSDGIYIEVTSGVSESDRIKKPKAVQVKRKGR